MTKARKSSLGKLLLENKHAWRLISKAKRCNEKRMYDLKEIPIGSSLKLSHYIPNMINTSKDSEAWSYIKDCYVKHDIFKKL